jgi:hypothetical protein
MKKKFQTLVVTTANPFFRLLSLVELSSPSTTTGKDGSEQLFAVANDAQLSLFPSSSSSMSCKTTNLRSSASSKSPPPPVKLVGGVLTVGLEFVSDPKLSSDLVEELRL